VNVLITGGAGFIGSTLAQALLDQGHSVVLLDNFNDYYDPALKRANVARLRPADRVCLVEGDLRQPADVARAFAALPIDRVAHLAAMAGVRSATPVEVYGAVNIMGTLHMLEAARQHRVALFVMASTSSVYGETPILPFVETDSADRPLTPYAATKRAAELLGHTYHHLHGMQITVLRLFNVYGPYGRPDMMPMKLFNASQTGAEVLLFNDGELARDWTYVDDTVAGIVQALHTPLGYEVINLGLGSPIRMRAFVEIIEALTGQRLNTRAVPTPPSDPPITFCNNEKARRLLGFDPQVPVAEGLARTWEWFRRR
jgi:UDP-glucuronate 4-epimerase